MSAVKVFKKGEALFKEGEKPTNVFLIQSGSVSLQMTRHKVVIDLCNVGSMQIVGEHGLSGASTNPHSAISLAETKAIELSLDAVKTQIEHSPQLLKFLIKGMSDKNKVVMREFQSMKLERDPSPCPSEQTAKIFGTLFHVAKTKGEIKDGVIKVNWPLMKQYAQRVFLESPKRLKMAVNIFVKLGCAQYEMVKDENDPEAPEDIGFVTFTDISLVEEFFEFYQYYYFKGGKLELLKTDDRAFMITQALVEMAANEPLDRHGAVRLDYPLVVEKVKEATGIQLASTHFALLEIKGLFVQRQSSESGVILSFDVKEFARTIRIWKVLREVERWNEKGSVDPNEPVSDPKKMKAASDGHQCPSCHHSYEGHPKFCSECGHRLTMAA